MMGDLQGIFVEDQVDRQEVPSINVWQHHPWIQWGVWRVCRIIGKNING